MNIIQFVVCLLAIVSLSSQGKNFTVNSETFEVTKLNKQLYVASQSYGNTRINFGIVVGEHKIALISSMMRNYAPTIEQLIKHISRKPIGYVISIDSDPFHHHANQYFAEAGAITIGHQGLQSEYPLMLTYKDEMIINLGNETLRLVHTSAHTAGHSAVMVSNSNAIFVGDGIRNDWLMYSGENGPKAQLKGLQTMLSLADDNTHFYPGNRGQKISSSKAELTQLKDRYQEFVQLVTELYQQGLSAEQICAAPEMFKIVRHYERYEELHPYLIHHVNEVLDSLK
ncbi:hypothetical protein [Neptunicella marina]|uniref:MBL fold metallo-hydrolase n=1 Tax=Neptunicella marina TaxID=2125989 RepID=A0A8J6ITD0_9ALTE|nr:hypothetical protein [Neptunicella marina]MBC3765527.1 hypothetical protein [Neptunicella marina]